LLVKKAKRFSYICQWNCCF